MEKANIGELSSVYPLQYMYGMVGNTYCNYEKPK